MPGITEQVKAALKKERRTTADLAKWLDIGRRAAQKKMREESWRASELHLLSERLNVRFDVNANSEFTLNEPSVNYGTARPQPIQLNITIDGQQVHPDRIQDFLKKWNELVGEFEKGS